jgi:ferredoxin-NADP reductase
VQLRLIYASDSEEELLMKQHLDALAAGYYGKFKVKAARTFIKTWKLYEH